MIHHWLKGKECIVKYIYSFKNTTIQYSSECVCLSVCMCFDKFTYKFMVLSKYKGFFIFKCL